jgi:iron complex outermembrane receptor protein
MKKLLSAMAMMALPCIAFAQFTLTGTVKNKSTNEPVAGAAISIENTYYTVTSNAEGKYQVKNLEEGNYIVHVWMLGYEMLTGHLSIAGNIDHDLLLTESSVLGDEVIIQATRADERSGVAYTNVSKDEIEKSNLGQDVPYLLNSLPSVVVTSDAGAGVGYSGIRIRGTDPSRINVTINGIPVNDAESQGTFWVDIPDIASSIDNMQVQRGVGTSTNGAGAFGGSINVQTTKLNAKPYAELNNSYGSFNTIKNTLLAGSGLIDSAWTFDTRLSNIRSDGYIDRASSDLGSYYVSGAYYGKSTIIKAITFSGVEETYQAWYGVHEDSLKTNRTFNPAGMYFDEAGNMKFYDNQVDHYRQDYYQLHFSKMINPSLNLNAALHYTKGSGYYEEYKEDQGFGDYGLDTIVIDSANIISTTDLIRRKWLDNDFYGFTFSANYDSHKQLAFTFGGGWNKYDGDHFGEITWAQYAGNSSIRERYYNDNAVKTDLNVFAKAAYTFAERLHVFTDLQYRSINYTFLGFDADLDNVTQTAKLSFINPKAGITYDLNEQANVYASYSMGNKEPNRDDYTQSTPSSRPLHETLNDIEIGYRHNMKKAAWSLNAYYMMYKNQLVLTGEINDVGAYNRSNVDDSYRAGIEAEFGWKIFEQLEWAGNVTLSRNKIKNFVEYIDDYDTYTQIAKEYAETDIAFSPNIVASSIISFSPVKSMEMSLFTKYVGKQYLDNTSNDSRKIDPYLTNDLRASYSIKLKKMREIGITFIANNIFNELYESNGYTFSYIYGGEFITENYYYPQAEFNWLAGVSLKF